MKKILTIILPIILIFLTSLYLFLKDDLELDLLFQKPYQKTPQEIQKAKERIERYQNAPIVEETLEEVKAPWEKLEKGIYFNPKTLKINGDKRTAQFIILKTRDREISIPEIDDIGIKVSYEERELSAWCTNSIDDALRIERTKYYDENKKLLKDDINNYSVDAPYTSFVDGEIFYDALCR